MSKSLTNVQLRPLIALVALALLSLVLADAIVAAAADFGQWASTPPMGWNSWDVYGSSVTEAEVKSNADYMAQNLKPLGWEYVTVDIRWTDQSPGAHSYNRANPVLTLDDHGRFLPAPNRFPSAAAGNGFKPLADYLHAEGLKFGIHIMRGMPKIAHAQTGAFPKGYPIAGSAFTTLDVPIVDNGAKWLPDMVGIAKSDAGQAYYDSLFQLYADWGVDFVKVDDLDTTAGVYYQDEIDMIRAAIDKTGRPIVLSASPGPVPLANAAHISQNANMWRVANDFWDRWKDLVPQFNRLNQWTEYRSAGHWPDADMLPLGRIAIRGEVGTDRVSNFTHDEQQTLLTLWCIARSPLIFGGDLPTSDEWTKALIANPDVIAVDQHSANNRQLFRIGDQVAWIADAPDGKGKYLALFNLNGTSAAPVAVKLADLDINGDATIRDLWSRQDLGTISDTFSPEIAPHGAGLYLVGQESDQGAAAVQIEANVRPFDLSQVRLVDGPFKAAQGADAKYMASLDLDRLLHNFRVTAGLPSDAKPLGGWEAPGCELRGHFVGHYLSACALMYKSTGDPEWKRRVDYLVTELRKCQDAIGTGYLSAFPPAIFDKLEAGVHVWAPYYTIHKIMAGLLDAYQLCGNSQALDIDKKMAAYFADRISKLDGAQIEKTLHTTGSGPGTEFGGMSIVLHQLYGITGDRHDLALANTFDRDWLAVPLAHGEDPLTGLHANTHIPQVDGFAWHYRVTGDTKYRDAAVNFWQLVTDHHSFVTGSNSFGEHFAKAGIEASRLSPRTAETCNTYNMLKLTRDLFQLDPKPQYADYYERALFNHILGSIDPATGMTTYFLSLAPGHFKVYSTPTDSFWCCTGTGLENHAKYGDSIYFHDDNALWVNLFIPSELNWQEKGITLRQETKFPEEAGTTLVFHASRPTSLAVNLRVPSWVTHGASVKINGEVVKAAADPGSYLTLQREWNDGDRIEYSMPMDLRIYHATDTANSIAIMFGPIVLAGQFGTDGVPDPPQAKDQNEFNKLPRPDIPTLATDDDAAKWLKPMPGVPLTFQTIGVGKPTDVTLVPLYRVRSERYTVYWKIGAQEPMSESDQSR
jgi:DUF1680 family protein